MARWAELEMGAPALAAAGWRLFHRGSVPIGFMATIAGRGAPRLAPVCPIFANGDVYLSVGAHTPKKADLKRDGQFVLHAFLGTEDEEFQVSGRAIEVENPDERARVLRAIAFGAYDPMDPIFRLDLERCLHVRWDNVGRLDTRAIRTAWTASSGRVRESHWSLPQE
jgi:hypothetical protein